MDERQYEDPYGDGVPRRSFLKASGAAGGAAAASGCMHPDDVDVEDAVYVYNTGDMTVSVIDVEQDEVVSTPYIGATSSYPSNQWSVVESHEVLWMNVEGGVKGFDVSSFDELVYVETGSSSNWQEVTPDGDHLVVSAREPTHQQLRVDSDPDSSAFGDVTGRLERVRDGGAGPCDVTCGADGGYAYVPDIFSDTVTVVSVDPFEVAAQVEVEPDDSGGDVQPFMATASWNGDLLAVENMEGTESVYDVSNPLEPVEVGRLSPEDGFGRSPWTSEWSTDDRTLYVFTPDSGDVTVVDAEEPEVVDRLDVGGEAYVGSWDSRRRKLYAPLQNQDEVAVIDDDSREVVDHLSVGSAPFGATARRNTPDVGSAAVFRGALASVGVRWGEADTTYCDRTCFCGDSCR